VATERVTLPRVRFLPEDGTAARIAKTAIPKGKRWSRRADSNRGPADDELQRESTDVPAGRVSAPRTDRSEWHELTRSVNRGNHLSWRPR